MAGKTFYERDLILNRYRNTGAGGFTSYFGLLSAAPATDGDTGTELPNSDGYSRQALTFSAPATNSGRRKIAVSVLAELGPATADWTEAVAWAIYTSGTYGAGNLVRWGLLKDSGGSTVTRTVERDGYFQVRPDDLAFEE